MEELSPFVRPDTIQRLSSSTPVCLSCGTVGPIICRGCLDSSKSIVLDNPTPNISRILTLGHWGEKALNQALWVLKGHPRAIEIATVFGNELVDRFQSELLNYPTLVPVPLYQAKLSERGYNQAQWLAETIAVRTKQQVSMPVKRIRNTQKQFSLPRDKRLANVSGAFAANDTGIRVSGNVTIVDDIFSWGDTTSEIAGVLRENGADNIIVIAVGYGLRNSGGLPSTT